MTREVTAVDMAELRRTASKVQALDHNLVPDHVIEEVDDLKMFKALKAATAKMT